MKAKTEEERRALWICAGLIQRQKREISARIPLQPQCAHWGSFSPEKRLGCGDAVMASSPYIDISECHGK